VGARRAAPSEGQPANAGRIIMRYRGHDRLF
jgi:hypothetical protein